MHGYDWTKSYCLSEIQVYFFLPTYFNETEQVVIGSTIFNCTLVSPVHTDKNMIRFRQIVPLKSNYHWFHGLRNLAGKKGGVQKRLEFGSMRVGDAQAVGQGHPTRI